MTIATRPVGWGGPAALLGIALPLATQAIVPIWTFPATTTSGAGVASWAAAHRGPLEIVVALDAIGVVLWAVFGADLWTRLRRIAPDSSLPTVFGVAVAGFTTLLLTGFTAFALLVGQTPPASVAHFVYDLCFGLLAMSGLPTAVAMAAFLTLVAPRHLFRPATLTLAALTAAVHLVLLATLFFRTGVLALEGPFITLAPAFLFAWIAATGTSLLRRDLLARQSPA